MRYRLDVVAPTVLDAVKSAEQTQKPQFCRRVGCFCVCSRS
jgi:hypothetical protein